MSLNHPPKNQLIAFGQGKLAADESSSVEQHLEVCRECCETLLDLKDDTFVGLVRIAKTDNALADVASVCTDSGPDASRVGDDSAHAATMLVQSGAAVTVDELPLELREHPRYRIVELIGRGGMGNVYRAEHRLMNRAVAIKLINSQLVQHPHAVERFRREVQAAAKLSHPNIVAAYDAEQAGNAHFLVMEFVEGTDLASVVKQRGPMSVADACDCIRQAAAGLQHAHEKGMVHRDMKPHNLMLAASGQVRILDFGLAGFAEAALESSPVAPRQESRTLSDSDPRDQPSTDDPAATRDWLSCRGATGLQVTAAHLTTMGSVMGTPDYMAPEQAADAHSADIRADIYSLGCTLHFLLTGKPPFEADNVLAKLKAHAVEPPPSLKSLRSDVPDELSKIAARMMAKNPADRFQTPAEVVETLTQLVKPAVSPPKRRLRTLVAALLLALLAGVIVVQTDKGRIEIHSEVDDVEVSIQQDGQEIAAIDMQTGSKVKWFPSGKYDVVLKGDRNDVKIHNDGFTLSRWGTQIVTLKRTVNPLATPDAQDNAADRKAAEYALSIGGTVRIRQNGEERQIVAGGDVTLPPGPLELTYVSLVGNQNVTDAGLAVFKDCARLTHLYLQSTPVSNSGTVHFQKCKNLKFLDLGSTRVSDAGLAAFKNCKNLLSLNLGATHVTDEGLANFKDCHDLRTLYFYNAPNVNDVGMSYFKHCSNLMLLHLHGTKVTDVGLANFKECSRISYLQLGKAPVGDEGLANFANCKNLRVVCLETTQVTDAGLANFKDCHDLEHLALNDTKVGDAGLGFIKDCKRLIALHVPRTNVTASLIDDLKTALPQCKIEWNNQVIEPKVKRISDQDAAKWVLSLGGKVRAAGVDHAIQFLADLPEWPAITSIDLAGNQEVTNAGLAFLKDAHHLVQLDLSGTALTNAGLKHLTGCSRLVNLNANNTKVDEAGIQQLAAALPDCKIDWDTGTLRSKDASASGESPLAAMKDSAAVLMYLNDPRNNRGGSVPVALLGQNGRVAFRFGNWLVVFEGIVCDPKATILGFSNFNVPQPGTRGEGTVDFGAGKQLPGVLIKFKFANDTNEISINNYRFKLKGKATRLEFDDKAYDATNSVQTILVARDGATRLAESGKVNDGSQSSLTLERTIQEITQPMQWIEATADGKHIFTAGGGEIEVRDAVTLAVVRTLKTERLRSRTVAASPKEYLLANGGHDGWLELWNWQTAERLAQVNLGSGWIEYMEWLPEGKSLVLKCVNVPGYVVWNVADRRIERTCDESGQAFVISPDGRWLAAGDRLNGTVRVFEVATGKVRTRLPHHTLRDRVRALAFSPDGHWLLTGADDRQVKLWDVENGRLLHTFQHPGGIHAAEFLSDGRHFVTGCKDARTMTLWNVENEQAVATANDVVVGEKGLVLLADGRHVATTEPLFQLPKGEVKGTLQLWRLPENLNQPAAALSDAERLQGKWVPESCRMRGKPLTAEQLARMAITLTGDRATFTDPDSGFQQTGRFSIDASRSPKHIDFIAPDASERMPGIFEFDGEQLKMAWCDGDYARPTNFAPADTPDHMTAVLKRVPGSVPATAPQDEPTKPFVPDASQLEAVKSAEAYLSVVDEGKFGELWNKASSLAKRQVTRDQVSQTYQKLRDTFGKATQRTLTRVQVYDDLPNLPKGRYALVQYKTDCERQKGLWEVLLLNVDWDTKWHVNSYQITLEPPPFPDAKSDPAIEQKKQAALSAAQEWLKLVDAGQYAESWEASARINRDGITKEKLVDAYNELFKPLGKPTSREHKSSEYTTQMPRAPIGEYAVNQFRTQFTNQRVVETVVLTREPDSQWRVSGYFHAEDTSVPMPPPQRTGLLTNPPKLPQGGVPVGKNLIVDSSLEATATGQIPQGWFAWLNDGPNFKCEVVEGGVTGKHCLQISGTGTRGVVFATSIPMDRTKRFALKGRVKVEGEAGTRAVIKLNYFNNTGWLGVDDRIGVTTADLDWKLVEKTDLADQYPGATLIVPTCQIEGNGTAWFDDLEVIAYDRDKLPDDFDATHGRNNRMK